jgi:hypothetical protein
MAMIFIPVCIWSAAAHSKYRTSCFVGSCIKHDIVIFIAKHNASIFINNEFNKDQSLL